MILDCIALDLEATLISNVVSQFPRPGLYAFLEEIRPLSRHIVLYSAASVAPVTAAVRLLVAEGLAPVWFGDIPRHRADGEHKDLRVIPGVRLSHTVLVDDMHTYAHPEQQANLLLIAPFEPPFTEDGGFPPVVAALRARIAALGNPRELGGA